MVADEAAVLPDARALDPDDDGPPFAFEDIDGDHRPRAPRPSQDDKPVETHFETSHFETFATNFENLCRTF